MNAPKKPVQRRKLKWVIQIEVDPLWVADGFDMDDDGALDMLSCRLGYASTAELGARVLKRPAAKIVSGLQSGAIGFPGDDEGSK